MENKVVVKRLTSCVNVETDQFEWLVSHFDLILQLQKPSVSLCVRSSCIPDLFWKLTLDPVITNDKADSITGRRCPTVTIQLSFSAKEYYLPIDVAINISSSQIALIDCRYTAGTEAKLNIARERLTNLLLSGDLHLECNVTRIPDKIQISKYPSGETCKPNSTTSVAQFSLKDLLDHEFLSDCAMKVGEETFKCHKCILAFHSPVFRSMFEHCSTEEAQTGVVTIKDNSVSSIQGLLEFMYTGSVETLDEMAEELLVIAEKYDISSLKLICSQNLTGNMDINNVCHLMAVADVHSADELKEACFDFIFENRKTVLKTHQWQTLKASFPNLAINALEWIGCK